MGLYEEQINLRKKNDIEAFEDSCLRIAGSVIGQNLTAALSNEREQAKDAIGQVLKYYHVKVREVPDRLTYINEVLDVNPSAENIARWICDHVENCYKVSVQESEGNVAIYEREDL